LEERWKAVDLIDDHQLAGLLAQESLGVGQSAAIGLALQVEVDGAGTPSGDQPAGQRGLSHLSWSEQHNSGQVSEAILDRGGHPSSEGSHSRNSNIKRLISGGGSKYPIWYVGRQDDLFKSRGYLIAPKEIEDAILEHP